MKASSKPTDQEIKAMNRTNRATGAIGVNAIVPRVIQWILADYPSLTCLDFGSGKWAIHTQQLKSFGYDVTACEIGSNFNPEIHDVNALDRTYDIVFMSNVLNVLGSEPAILWTLSQVKKAMHSTSQLICNYPNEPRKSTLSAKRILELLEYEIGACSLMHGKLSKGPIFKATLQASG